VTPGLKRVQIGNLRGASGVSAGRSILGPHVMALARLKNLAKLTLLIGAPVAVLVGLFSCGVYCGHENRVAVLKFERDWLGFDVTVPGEPKPEPVKTEPVKTEPVKTEPVKTEPVKTEPVKTEPVKTEPVKTEPVVAVKVGRAAVRDAGAGAAERGEPGQARQTWCGSRCWCWSTRCWRRGGPTG
jgi:hypothetical protein